MVYVSKKHYTRAQLNLVAALWFLMSVVLFCTIIQPTVVNDDIRIEGEFQSYAEIANPSLSRPTKRRYEYLFTVDSRTYSINPPIHRYFNVDNFTEEVFAGDRVVLYLDDDSDIIGIQANNKIYLSLADSQKAMIFETIIGWLLTFIFFVLAVLFFLYANVSKVHKATNDFFERLERKWKHRKKMLFCVTGK